ncbi:MAG: hypothetical protein HYX92_04730 [Chloroflexi bacterium]|nr:hypothetical protein [Chloroflexota bacterium]
MKSKISRTVLSCISAFWLLLTSCASPAAPTLPSPTPKEAATAPKPTIAATTPTVTPKPAADQPRYGGILNIGHYADPATYDPIQESSLQSESLIVPSYSGIVQHDPLEPTKVVGDLAHKWETSSDGKVYTFHLYNNVKWHDGTPFTSEDARFSLEVVRKPPTGVRSPRQEWLKAVERTEAPDKDTLKMTLQYPSASFLDNLGDGRMVIVPKHVYESKGNMRRDVVGTGPYKFKSFSPGASWSAAKNSDYFIKGRPYLDGIIWYIIPDLATRFAALRTHRIQVTPFGTQGLTPSQSEIIRKELSDKIIVQRCSSPGFLSFRMPNTKAPWSDLRVRRAVELTIDRPKVIKVAMEGVADVGGFMPPGEWSLPDAELLKMPGFRQTKDADIAEAKRFMAEAGHARGIKTTTVTRNVAI